MIGVARPLGATVEEGGVRFRGWVPGHDRVDVEVRPPRGEAGVELHPLVSEGEGYFAAFVEGAGAGDRYRFAAGGECVPDPASRSQPEGVHGASEIVDPARFSWSDGSWRGVMLEDLSVYELHVGTATQEGTFEALIQHLDHFVELGVTALELMPVVEFAGRRGWGYDGVYWFAPHHAYGGPEGLRRLIDAAHARGLAVILDVVYNHFGPEGNYLPALTSGRIFDRSEDTPWGAAIDYGRHAVRELAIGSALHWAREYHVDGLRLDATHAIRDPSLVHLLRELCARVRGELPDDRHFLLTAEDERNERRLVLPVEEGGYGLDAVWADDFHHQLRRLVAGDREGYYRNYTGSAPDLAATLRRGWFHQGEPYGVDGKPRGTPAADIPPPRFVHSVQNHDQVGNRALGERLNHQVEPAVFRAACALLLLSPYTPLLWMGQEWAASTPFLYFTDHPEELGRLVTQGRRREFRHFSAFADPAAREHIPDPQAEATFLASKLCWEERSEPEHAGVLRLHRELLALRRTEPALRHRGRDHFAIAALGDGAIALRRSAPRGGALLLMAALGGGATADLHERDVTRPPPQAAWRVALASEEARFGGGGSGWELDGAGALRLQGPGAVLLRAETAR